MTRPLCSYFLHLEGAVPLLEQAGRYLRENGVVPCILSPDEPGSLSDYSVPEGSTEQWSDMPDVMRLLSEKIPGVTVSIQEQNEEPWCPDRSLAYQNGQETRSVYGRRIAPGELDKETVKSCVRLLQERNLGEAAFVLTSLLDGD